MGKDLKGKELGEGVRQLRNGSYIARCSGCGKRISRTFDSLIEARLWVDSHQNERKNPGLFRKEFTLDSWFGFWIEDVKRPSVKYGTYISYKDIYENRIKDTLGGMRLSEILPIDCQKLLNDESKKPKVKEEELKEDVIERPELSQEEQALAHKEAEEVVRDKLVKSGYDCSGWILDNEDNDGRWHSYNQIEGKIKDSDGVPVNVVIKSAKGGYIYLSATDFEFLTQDSKNLLLVWDGDDVHSVSGEDLFTKDSNVNLIFDTEYTPKHYYAALSKVFQYVKRTTFAVKDPKRNTFSQVQGFGMDAKTEGIQELFDDNDL